jgi:phage terminase large subunit-like protein
MPRKNGKSLLGAILALYALAFDGEQGAEVYSVAGSRDQARIIFGTAARMVELDPHLRRHLTVQRYDILHKPSGSSYRVLAADAGHAEGLNPHLVVFDEVHVQGSDRRLWDTMNLGSGTRDAPLVIGFTTPGVRYGTDGRDSLAWSMYDHARRVQSGEVSDPAFFSRVWEAPADCDVWDREAWRVANPALGDFLNEEDMEAAARATPENEFRTKRLGQWVSAQAAWMPYGSWDACAVHALKSEGMVVLGFDGSFSGDSTALVAATIEPHPYLTVIAVWEKSPLAPATWRVDRAAVKQAIRDACRTYQVREIVADPHLWVSELQELAAEGLPVIEYPQTPSRMIPAAQRFYEATTTGVMRHDGDATLARHVGNTTVRPNGHLAKEHKDSGRKIDLAIASVMAYDRAAVLGTTPERPAVFVL